MRCNNKGEEERTMATYGTRGGGIFQTIKPSAMRSDDDMEAASGAGGADQHRSARRGMSCACHRQWSLCTLLCVVLAATVLGIVVGVVVHASRQKHDATAPICVSLTVDTSATVSRLSTVRLPTVGTVPDTGGGAWRRFQSAHVSCLAPDGEIRKFVCGTGDAVTPTHPHAHTAGTGGGLHPDANGTGNGNGDREGDRAEPNRDETAAPSRCSIRASIKDSGSLYAELSNVVALECTLIVCTIPG